MSPRKLPDPTQDPRKAADKPKPKPTKSGRQSKGVSAAATEIDSDQEVEPGADELPSLNGNNPDASASRGSEGALTPPLNEDASSVLPTISSTKTDVLGTPQRRDKNPAAPLATPGALGLPSMPPPLTPSVTQVLSRAPDVPPPPLPAGLTVASLRSRSDGKKKIKYVRKKTLVLLCVCLWGTELNTGVRS